MSEPDQVTHDERQATPSGAISLSVIVCTHNPRPDYLQRCLDGLRRQTLAPINWKLVVVDNASATLVARDFDTSWHPAATHVREDELGLTPARIRGVRESRGDLLIFVDDDNVLSSDYLAEAVRLAHEWPILGAWGGTVAGEFDQRPAPWVLRYQSLLTIREIDRARWSSVPTPGANPCGAGLCVRRTVAVAYLEALEAQPLRRLLDRRGTALLGCGDLDLAFCACDVGLGIGRFPTLKVTHLIPVHRAAKDYLERAQEGAAYSEILLRRLRGWSVDRPTSARRLVDYLRAWTLPGDDRRMRHAWLRGRQAALRHSIDGAGR